jgi:RNA polymerase I-specific transcription initiation factor RRN6
MLLVNFYCFWLSTDASGSGTSFNGSLTLISDSGQLESEIKSSQTFCVLPTPLTSISSPSTMRPELQYVKQDVRFFQLWILTSDLGLNSTLLSVIGSSPEQMTRSRLLITAPNTKISQPSRPQGPRVVKDSFIVSDGMGDERFWRNSPGNPFQYHMISSVNDQERDDLRFRLNWVTIFQHVFGLKNRQNENFDEPVESPEEVLRIDELLGRVLSLLQEERGEGVLRSRTL